MSRRDTIIVAVLINVGLLAILFMMAVNIDQDRMTPHFDVEYTLKQPAAAQQKSEEIAMVFNTTFGSQSIIDSFSIRRSALVYNVAYYTAIAGMEAVVDGILAMQRETLDVTPLQEYYPTSG